MQTTALIRSLQLDRLPCKTPENHSIEPIANRQPDQKRSANPPWEY
ncbi:hypothetical protein [Leptolyngbya ohadii]|nr:hypothetical protein [Leptolyngbya ohadii]